MYESLKGATKVAIDIETHDPNLRVTGCGAQRDGKIVGISLATDTGVRVYYSIAHPNSQNEPLEKVIRYLNNELHEYHRLIGANILYDLEYLCVAGFKLKSKLFDIQTAEPLIDENQFTYSLNSQAKKYLNEEKKIDWLADKCKQLGLKGDPRAHIWQFDAKDIAPYAIGDVDLPLRIYDHQMKIIEKENLKQVLSIELRLLPLLLQMKLKGCRMDVRGTEQFKADCIYKRNKLLKQIAAVGLDASTSHAGRAKLEEFFKEKGLFVPYTAKTKRPSFTAPYLATIDQPEIKWITECKQLEKLIGTFLNSQILGTLIDDRIHAQFNALRDSEGGTVTGRFSSSKPNLQNMPSRNKELAPRCRALFLPEEGEQFGSIDYSQIEYRLLCHFAKGETADDIRAAFRENPKLDIHQWCADIAGVGRDQAKAINFGIIYGQGAAKTAAVLNISVDEAKAFLLAFNQKMPFARATANEAAGRAERRGYVKTILGRRRRFNLWEPSEYLTNAEKTEKYPLITNFMLPQEEAKEVFGNVKRAQTYKALNAVIQGSSADLLKLAMVKAYEAGLFKILTPLTTVHDELNVSVPQTKEGQKAYKELVNIMETCYTFRVPIITESGLGKNWSEAKSNAKISSNNPAGTHKNP